LISEFEQRLANILGARLPTPFTGRVDVPPGPQASSAPRILIGVASAEAVEPDIGSRRPELTPGVPDPRRVARLRCTVQIEVHPGQNNGRAQALQGLDACLFALQSADVQDGSALAGGAPDPGFLIQSIRLATATAPLNPETATQGPVSLSCLADGWFWPVGVPGQAGRQIGEIRVRGATLPIEVSPVPVLIAGGTAVDLVVGISPASTIRLTGQPAPPVLPFGRLAFALFAPGGKPGKGVLSGGSAGVNGVRLVDLVTGRAALTYTPPAEPAVDELVIGMEDGESGLGIELGRTSLVVRGG
jgi:hypothetical protein